LSDAKYKFNDNIFISKQKMFTSNEVWYYGKLDMFAYIKLTKSLISNTNKQKQLSSNPILLVLFYFSSFNVYRSVNAIILQHISSAFAILLIGVTIYYVQYIYIDILCVQCTPTCVSIKSLSVFVKTIVIHMLRTFWSRTRNFDARWLKLVK